MPVEIIFPRVDMDMISGRIGSWLVLEGQPVREGEPLFEIETDKAAMEIEAPASGTLRGVRAAGGEEVAVGSGIGWIVADGEQWDQPPPETDSAPLRATPLARREARRLGVDLSDVRGSGPRGRVVADDLPRASTPTSGWHRQWLGAAKGTPLVFLHGFGADLTGWRAVWTGLRARRRILAIDLPGHGRSSADAPASLDGLAQAVRRVLEEEAVTTPHLIGHSLGGAVALSLADSVRCASVCLIAPAGLGPEIDGDFLRGFAGAERAQSLAPWLRRLFNDAALVTPELVQAALRVREDPAARAYQRALITALFPDDTQAIDLCGALARLRVPAKLIWGTHDAIIPVRQANRLPGAIALHRLECGHMPHLEQPRLVASLIDELVRSA
ncbi:acetoin dehydrogenase dihydrolipoyllysine-residue acetyltransferase subunit [Lichenicoccus sp.]|uniref:acetoin dehydrogenase dihydrolipoyllysine-residue acetyltransferase subunit n=1 Tax=Lichenicoccus sp. TaxID=2781899 RepID=UPI003D0F2C02